MKVIGNTKKRKNQTVDFWFIRDINHPYLDENNNVPNVISLTSTLEEALEYINRRLKIDNYDHFESWCNLRSLKVEDEKSWELYFKKVLKDITPYTYFKVKVDIKALASICRIFYGCVPIGCSFDTIMETANMLVNIPQEELDNIKSIMDSNKGELI